MTQVGDEIAHLQLPFPQTAQRSDSVT